MTSDITVAVSFSSIPTAGDQLNVTCTATVPQRLVYTPSAIVISYNSTGGQKVVVEDNADATQSEVSQDGNIFSRVVTIDSVKTNDARRYYCLVLFNQPLDTSPQLGLEYLSVNSKFIGLCRMIRIIIRHLNHSMYYVNFIIMCV